MKQIKRVKYSYVSDKEAFDAFQLICKTEGILIAFEPAFAVAHGIKLAKEMGKDKILVLNICGRGDKDIDTAEKILGEAKTLEQMWEKVVEAYEKKKYNFADAVLNAQLARILRDGDFDFDTGEVSLWTP